MGMQHVLEHSVDIRRELESFIKNKQSESGLASPWKTDFFDRLLPFATSGKLLRGSLVCFSYKTFSHRPINDSVVRAAAALELAHSALLIHDDIMDNDGLRRGQPSLHLQYQSLGIKKKVALPEHFGMNMAMCGGDIALFSAFELLTQCEAPPLVKNKLQQLFINQLIVAGTGQMQDLYFEASAPMPSKTAIYELMRAKTASYTLALPLLMGALLAGEPNKTLKRLQVIGNNAGMIFQIRDDELGVLGNTDQTGKPVGSDITEGKKTLFYYYLFKQCDATERKKLKTIFGNGNASETDISYVKGAAKRYQVTQLLNNEVKRLEKQTHIDIEKLTLSKKAKKELIGLVHFCGSRQA